MEEGTAKRAEDGDRAWGSGTKPSRVNLAKRMSKDGRNTLALVGWIHKRSP